MPKVMKKKNPRRKIVAENKLDSLNREDAVSAE